MKETLFPKVGECYFVAYLNNQNSWNIEAVIYGKNSVLGIECHYFESIDNAIKFAQSKSKVAQKSDKTVKPSRGLFSLWR